MPFDGVTWACVFAACPVMLGALLVSGSMSPVDFFASIQNLKRVLSLPPPPGVRLPFGLQDGDNLFDEPGEPEPARAVAAPLAGAGAPGAAALLVCRVLLP